MAFNEWREAGLALPNLKLMRQYRLDRIVEHINQRDYAAVLLFDPLNIRYATDSTNMQLWNSHDPFRACLVCGNIICITNTRNSSMVVSTTALAYAMNGR